MKKLHLPIVLFCLTICISCGNKPSMDTHLEKEPDTLFGELFPADEPGAAVLVARGNSILIGEWRMYR